MRRFKLYKDLEAEEDCCCEMVEAAAGNYVLYADHMKEMGRFQAAINVMERRIAEIKALLIRQGGV